MSRSSKPKLLTISTAGLAAVDATLMAPRKKPTNASTSNFVVTATAKLSTGTNGRT